MYSICRFTIYGFSSYGTNNIIEVFRAIINCHKNSDCTGLKIWFTKSDKTIFEYYKE